MRRSNWTDFSIEGARNEDLARRIAAVEARTAQDEAVTVLFPEVDGSFQPLFEAEKNRVYVTLAFFIPGTTRELVVVLVERNKMADATAYDIERIKTRVEDISDEHRAAGRVEARLKQGLKYSTQYDVIRLVAIGDEGARVSNPAEEPQFAEYPGNVLFSFTTPQKFGSPSAPHLGGIIENQLDDTTKAFDAFLVVQVIAPASVTTNATGTVAVVSGSTTITGTGTSFLSQLLVGRGVTVNGETHVITAVTSNTQATVDFPFRQTASGQMAILTLMTWEEAQAERVISKFRLTDDPAARAISHTLTDDELDDTSVIFRVTGFVAARRYSWTRNVIAGHGERKDSPAPAPVTFVAGGFTDATAGIPELTGVAYQYDTTDPFNGKRRLVSVLATQPNPPVALDRAELRRFTRAAGTVSVTSGSATLTGSSTSFTTDLAPGYQVIIGSQTFVILSVLNNTTATTTAPSSATAGGQSYFVSKEVIDDRNLRRPKFHPATGGQILINWGERSTRKLTQHIFRTTVFAQNGQTRNLDDNFTTDATEEGAAEPGALAFPSAPAGANNSVDGDLEKTLARIALTLATANGQSFSANNTSKIEIILIRRNAANTADLGAPFSETKNLRTGELSASSAVHEFFLRMGQRFRIIEVVARNADKRAPTAGTADFVAGGVLTVDPGDPKVVPAPFFQSVTNLNNKRDRVVVRVTQDGVDIVGLKALVVEQAIGGGAFEEAYRWPLRSEDALYASTSAFKDFTRKFKRDAGQSSQYRAFVTAIGGKSSAVIPSSSLGATGTDLAADTGAPVLDSPSAPTVEEHFGRLSVVCPSPVANFNSLQTCQVVMSTSPAAPFGEPIVGLEGVVKIKRGQFATFKAKQRQAENLFFYYRWANALFFSSWSAGASVNAADVGRPADDVIGTGVPRLACGLERAATSGSGHASTTFVLDGGASPVDGSYAGMVLHVPSENASDRIRRITAYNGATRTCTVSPGWDSTPGGFVAYELFYDVATSQIWGGRSGTGHTVNTFTLDAGASPVDDFYNGWGLYVPSLAAADRVRRIIDYNGATRVATVHLAMSAAPANTVGFCVSRGHFGNAAFDQSSSQYAPAPLRVWWDNETKETVIEAIAPTGENAYSLDYGLLEIVKRSNGQVKAKPKLPASATLEYRYRPPVDGFTPVARILFANRYRGGGSDGKSPFSTWVEGFQNGATGDNFNPGTAPPPEVDYLDDLNLPGSRYPGY